MNSSPVRTWSHRILGTVFVCSLSAIAAVHHTALAQDEAAPAGGTPTEGAATPADAPISDERVKSAANLIGQAFNLSGSSAAARINAARGAAALLPLLSGNERDTLTRRWITINQAREVPRSLRAEAYAAFFDVAARRDANWARQIAWYLPDAAARAGAFSRLSTVVESSDYLQAAEYGEWARRAARSEKDLTYRARALTYVADRIATLNPDTREAAVIEASSAVQYLNNVPTRDALWVDVAGAASHFNLPLARTIAGHISDARLKEMANARINLAEISQTTLMQSNSDRIASLAKAAARYEVAAIPILLQLPPTTDVLQTLSNALPPIYPTAHPNIDASLLERMWNYAQVPEPSVQRDELQSRLARLMMLHDLWRGRAWSLRLSWKGGRILAGAFLEQVLHARQSALKAEPLRQQTETNINRAIATANKLPPAARVEALLLIAGQILETGV